MTLSERSAYLKGLMDGLNMDTEKAEGKMIAAMVEMLEDISYAVSDLEEQALAVSDELDEIEDAIDNLEEVVYDEDFEDDYDDDDDNFEFADEDPIYEVTCPVCNEEIALDEDMLDAGSIPCPKCGEELEFDMDDEEDI
ncbi:MAG: hypothetical protein R3Y62_03575 [Eubacteriales bacterium]